jgi:hypothetical protein
VIVYQARNADHRFAGTRPEMSEQGQSGLIAAGTAKAVVQVP